MIPEGDYVSNLELVARYASTPGCVVECGTWRGGMIAGIAEVLGPSRRYYLFDSFEGLPPAREIDGPSALAWQADVDGPHYYANCRASEEDAMTAMALSGTPNYHIIKGWFAETLASGPPQELIAILRMDADWYDSTMCILEHLAPRMEAGGVIVVDDYFAWDGCARAVNEFAAKSNWRIRQLRSDGVCYILV